MAKKSPPRRRLRALIEELERRLLLSADIETVLGAPSLLVGADGSASGSQVELVEPGELQTAESGAADRDRREIVFVDAGTESYQQLVDDLSPF